MQTLEGYILPLGPAKGSIIHTQHAFQDKGQSGMLFRAKPSILQRKIKENTTQKL